MIKPTTIIRFKDGQRQVLYLYALEHLPLELRRILTLHLNELINRIEDCEDEGASIASVYFIRFLDDCYRSA